MKKIMMKKRLVINFFIVVLICFTSMSVYAQSNISFEGTNVFYASNDKKTIVVEGNLTNQGDNTATVETASLQLQCWDANGNLCVNDNANFANVNVTVRPGETVPWQFNIHNSHNTGYEGDWKWNVNFNANSTEW